MEAKIKHLEFIQASVNRMAGNSFLLKGWAVTLTGGLLALTFKEVDRRYLGVSALVLVLFWALDGYYLSRERRFIYLYDLVRIKAEKEIDFSMHTHALDKGCRWANCTFSSTLLLFYGGLGIVHLLITYFV
jgi:hypothetical protein